MKEVKIINGTYGYRLGNAKFITPVSAGMPPIEMTNEKAARLVAAGVAAYVCGGEVKVSAKAAKTVADSVEDDEAPSAMGAEAPVM